jgi:general stress protein YciG
MKQDFGDDYGPDEPTPTQERMSAIGKVGGARTKEYHGRIHFIVAGRKGGSVTKERMSPEFYTEIGRKGGLAKAARKLNT